MPSWARLYATRSLREKEELNNALLTRAIGPTVTETKMLTATSVSTSVNPDAEIRRLQPEYIFEIDSDMRKKYLFIIDLLINYVRYEIFPPKADLPLA